MLSIQAQQMRKRSDKLSVCVCLTQEQLVCVKLSNADSCHNHVQDLQPQLIKTVGEVEALMVRIAKEKAEVVQPKAAAVAVDEAAAQAKV